MSKGGGVACLIIGIFCLVMFAGFSYTSSPIKIIFPVAGIILIIVGIVLLARK